MINRLLILGSLDEFVLLVKKAQDMGIYTIVCDGYKNSPAKLQADTSYDIPVGDIDAIISMCKKEKVDGIITSFSDFLFECMVKIADGANLPCYASPAQLDYYRNKETMKSMFYKLGIPTPSFTTLDSNFQDEELSNFTFPVVVKPLDKYGSRGLKIYDDISSIRNNFHEICATSDIKKILVEEYNTGFEFNMMTWVLDGKIHVISIADREKTEIGNHEIPISSRNIYPSRLMNHVYEEAVEILQKAADYLHQTSGPLCMQFFWKPGQGIQVCEMAGRFFGYEHELVELSGGVCIEDILLAYACRDHGKLRALIRSHNPWFTKHSATLYFHGIEGATIVSQEKAKELAVAEHADDFILFYNDNSPITHFGKEPYVARYYITADTRESLDEKTDYIFRNISITDAAGCEVIYQNQMTDYSSASSNAL